MGILALHQSSQHFSLFLLVTNYGNDPGKYSFSFFFLDKISKWYIISYYSFSPVIPNSSAAQWLPNSSGVSLIAMLGPTLVICMHTRTHTQPAAFWNIESAEIRGFCSGIYCSTNSISISNLWIPVFSWSAPLNSKNG